MSMNMTVLWSRLASYSVAFFRALSVRHGWELQLIHRPVRARAPYEDFDLSFASSAMQASKEVTSKLPEIVGAFDPRLVLMASWSSWSYMMLTRQLRKEGVFVVSTMDNQWHGTPKQRLGVLAAPFYIKPSIDTFLVAGEPQIGFAKRLGYADVMYGLYAAEVGRFASSVPIGERPKSFLFVGRLSAEKGIWDLIEGYGKYRQQNPDPWTLKVVGTGPLGGEMEGLPGVELYGFVQPDRLPKLLELGSCLILPSRFEPWGVVLHEAAAAGLPLIATSVCGATSMFLRDGMNGYITPTGPHELARSMLRLSSQPDPVLVAMSQASMDLAKMWDPEKLAAYFVESVNWRLSLR